MINPATPDPKLATPTPAAPPSEAPTHVSSSAQAARPLVRPPPLALGLVLANRFVLERRLGSGGLAEVWAARDLHLGQDVAIKALHSHFASDASIAERFRRELAVTRGLDHPGIVKVYDFFNDGGRPFFALELLRGCSLAQRLAEGPVPREEALRIAREAAAALQVAHRQGVVHRDLKPHNLFLAEDPHELRARPRVVLLDFGLARAAGLSRMTALSQVLGTPGYIAPEVLSGHGCDGRADLYALGAVLFELLAGRRAFPSVDPQAALAQKTAPPKLEEALPGASEQDAALVARLLAPDPEQRFLDAGQVLRALGGAEARPVPEAPPALTAGQHDLVVQRGMGLGFAAMRALERVRLRLGVPKPGAGWRARFWLAGKNTLVTHASLASAERSAALCREEGLSAQVLPARKESLLAPLAARAGKVGLGLFGLFAVEGLFQAVDRALEMAVWHQQGWGHGHGRDLQRWLERLAQHPEYASATHWLQSYLPGPAPFLATAFLACAALAVGLGLFAPAPLGAAPGKARSGPGWLSALLAAGGAAALLRLQAGLEWLKREDVFHLQINFPSEWQRTSLLLPKTLAALWRGLTFDAAELHWFGDSGARHFALPVLALCAASLYAGLRSRAAAPSPLPSGDPVVRRLAAGIERRLASLRAWVKGAPPAEREVARALLSAAEEVALPAPVLAEAAARIGDRLEQAEPLSQSPAEGEQEAVQEQQRDLAIDRLLQIAAGLDDALQSLTAPGAAAARGEASAPLLRLKEELARPSRVSRPESRGQTPVDPQRGKLRP